jgi:hypothetical protein
MASDVVKIAKLTKFIKLCINYFLERLFAE